MARPTKFRLTPDDVLDPQNARKLAGHVAEIEFFRSEVEKLQAQIAGIYDAADEDGFDKKFIRKVVAIRAKDETVAQAEQAGIDAYTEALEIGFRSRARVENPEHDADGVIIENSSQVEAAAAHARSDDSRAASLTGTEGEADRSTVFKQEPNDEAGGHGGVGELGGEEGSQSPLPSDPVEKSADGPRVQVAAATNITSMFRINPDTHFANSKGLPRLHGCLRPETCGGTHRALCGTCAKALGQGSAA